MTAQTIPTEEREYPYDSLIVAAGAGQSYFGHDEFALDRAGHEDHRRRPRAAPACPRRARAGRELRPTEEQRSFWLTVVVVGAGPTGVELAGQVRELAVRSLKRDFRTIDPASVRVVLVDGGAEPLATFGDRLSSRAAEALTKMGVELRMHTGSWASTRVGVDVDGAGRQASGSPRGTVIWAAGVQASPLAGMLAEATAPTPIGPAVVAVLPDLSLPGHPEVFAVGDMASINKLPGVCEVAMQGGLHAANTIRRRLKGDTRDVPFKYRDLGSAAAIGRFKAIVSFHGVRLSGFPGWIGLASRPPHLPQRLRQPGRRAVALGPLDDRQRPPRTRLQRRPHRRRPQPAGGGPAPRHAQPVPRRRRRRRSATRRARADVAAGDRTAPALVTPRRNGPARGNALDKAKPADRR